MKNQAKTQEHGSQPPLKGEKERDNDAQRPDGSSGTYRDSTAQKTARADDRRKG